MEKYIVKLNSVYSEEIALQLKNENIYVHHQATLMPNLLIIETAVPYETLLSNGLFKSVEKNHIGRIDV